MAEPESKIQQPEVNIIYKCKRGDTNAFKIIVELYQKYLYNLAFKILLDEENTKDIVQDSFLKIWRNIKTYNEKYLFTTWIYRIVINNCYDFLKSQKVRLAYANEIDRKDTGSITEDTYSNRELIKQIRLFSRELSNKQRMVFILKDLQDLSLSEVSQILNMPKEVVKSNLYYARKNIKVKILMMEKQEETK